jgi:hypothetical protein
MLEKIEDILKVLTQLEENTTKQPFFAAPDVSQVLLQLSSFMEKGLDFCIRNLYEIKEKLESEESA